MTEAFDADWLALREPFDAAARDPLLAMALAAALPARPHFVDLGAGTGSLFRWLAPIVGGAQVWTLVDADAGLLQRAFADTADWAEDAGWTVTWPGSATNRALIVHTPGGAWRVQAATADIADVTALPLHGAHAVVCSALLDLVSRAWMAALVARLRVPVLACLSVDGRDALHPALPLDPRIRAAFRRDQRRDKGFGRALGPAAPAALHALLAARGFAVATAPSDWRMAHDALAMQAALLAGYAELARARLPRAPVQQWLRARLLQAQRGRLAIRVGHRDILGLPPA